MGNTQDYEVMTINELGNKVVRTSYQGLHVRVEFRRASVKDVNSYFVVDTSIYGKDGEAGSEITWMFAADALMEIIGYIRQRFDIW